MNFKNTLLVVTLMLSANLVFAASKPNVLVCVVEKLHDLGADEDLMDHVPSIYENTVNYTAKLDAEGNASEDFGDIASVFSYTIKVENYKFKNFSIKDKNYNMSLGLNINPNYSSISALLTDGLNKRTEVSPKIAGKNPTINLLLVKNNTVRDMAHEARAELMGGANRLKIQLYAYQSPRSQVSLGCQLK